jgi:hypothetical protein
MFAGGAGDLFGLGGAELGRTGTEWYRYAQSEVGQYDGYVLRTRKVANKAVRDQLIKDYYSDPENRDGALYRRNSVAANIAEAEKYTPVNYYVFESSQVQNRVEKLNDWNKDFKEDLQYAEATYGSLPDPVVIERLTTSTSTVTETPGWVTPVVVGAVAIAALAAFGVFKR